MKWFVTFHKKTKDIDPIKIAKHKYYLGKLLPCINIFTKVGINIVFNVAYLASFNSESLFPLEKRATAIGICNFVARIATILAPMVVKFKKPVPILLIIGVNLICLAVSFTLPSKD